MILTEKFSGDFFRARVVDSSIMHDSAADDDDDDLVFSLGFTPIEFAISFAAHLWSV